MQGRMLRKLKRWRFIVIGVMLIGSLLWLNSMNETEPVEVKPETHTVDQADKKTELKPIKKNPKPSSSQLNVVDIGADTLDGENRKPKVTLPVPTDVMQHVGDDEWISRSFYDKKAQCARTTSKENNEEINTKSNMTCQFPHLNPFHPSVMKFMNKAKVSNCERFRSCGKLVNGTFHITDKSVVSATYRGIFRRGDFSFELGTPVTISPTEKIKDEFIEIECKVTNGRPLREFWLQPVRHDHLVQRTAKRPPGLPLNILIVGIDSLSHAHAQRKLPELYEYMKKDLGAMIFNGQSIVGDGTTAQLTAILAGLGEHEQYESRRHHKNPRPVDGWTWIYTELKDHGYLTGFSGDSPHIGAWQLRLMGFQNPPTDFYTRPFYLRAARNLQGGSDLCLNSVNIAKFQFNYINDVFDTFPDKLKFFLSYNVQFSHDDLNQVSNVEPPLISSIKDLRSKGQLNNTLLIVMGDHGSRFGPMRMVLQGKLEERLPLFAMIFPPWIYERYPKIYKNLQINTDRLTSWYDLHATFRHMLYYPDVPSNIKHGQSLLEEVPTSRTCAQANVDEHWCPCQRWSAVEITDSHVQNAALAVVDYINNLNNEHDLSKKNCEFLTLSTVNYALMEEPNEKVLNYHDADDQVPVFKLSARPKRVDFCRYQLQFETSPNKGVYEATVKYHMGWFIVSKGVSRVNQYGDQPKCVAKQLPHLRKFCFCNNPGVSE